MIYVNNKEQTEKFKNINNYCAIIDFDRTITTGNSDASMGVVPKFLGGECLKERIKIYEHYRPLELNYTINEQEKRKIMKEWTNTSFAFMSKYITSNEIIEEALVNANIYLREGAKEFLAYLHDNNIPVVIMSAGLGNLIKIFLNNNNVLYDNITIVSNFYKFRDNKSYIDKELVAASNKDYEKLPNAIKQIIEQKDNVLLIGDLVEDIRMINKEQKSKTLTIGFLDNNIDINLNLYNQNFDIVLSENESFQTIIKILR